VIKVFSSTNNFYYSVVDTDKKLMGIITLAGIRNTFAKEELNEWLVALDLAEPAAAKVTPDVRLSQALVEMERKGIECVPVVASQQGGEYVGVLEGSAVRRRLSAKVLDKQREADSKFTMRAE
jgi:CBS domain-containing protein